MESIINDLFLVVFGIVLGVLVSDPLKKLFTGKYKEEARQKKRVKLLLAIREAKGKTVLTTEELAERVFQGKLNHNNVNKLLTEIEEIGLIKAAKSKNQDIRNTKWYYIGK